MLILESRMTSFPPGQRGLETVMQLTLFFPFLPTTVLHLVEPSRNLRLLTFFPLCHLWCFLKSSCLSFLAQLCWSFPFFEDRDHILNIFVSSSVLGTGLAHVGAS